MSEWRASYEKRIRSAQWRNMKRDIAKMRGGKCERCGSTHKLQLHHKTYERMGRELTSDLELLCDKCHEEADRERAATGREKSARARYFSALDTYATKKYGEDYEFRANHWELTDEFDSWLESRGEE